ncbi:MAG TPA: hypothetical protein VK077_06690 [Virgibacillus sp.]|nr:hypothetical protein [Virgibacillus sp.]
MKKLFATVALGALVMAGAFFAQTDQPVDEAMDLEPSIFSEGNNA